MMKKTDIKTAFWVIVWLVLFIGLFWGMSFGDQEDPLITMKFGHYMVIWVANGGLPIGVFLLFSIDHVIQWLIKWKKEGVI